MNPKMINILRWLAIIPAFIAGNVVSTVAFHLLSIPFDLQLIRDLNGSSDLAGHWIEGPFFLINKFFATGFCAGYAGIWIVPENQKKLAYNLFLWFLGLILLVNILWLIYDAKLFLEALGKSMTRHLLEIIPNVLGIYFGAFLGSRNKIDAEIAKNGSAAS